MMLLNNLIIRNRLKGKILRIERVKKEGKINSKSHEIGLRNFFFRF